MRCACRAWSSGHAARLFDGRHLMANSHAPHPWPPLLRPYSTLHPSSAHSQTHARTHIQARAQLRTDTCIGISFFLPASHTRPIIRYAPFQCAAVNNPRGLSSPPPNPLKTRRYPPPQKKTTWRNSYVNFSDVIHNPPNPPDPPPIREILHILMNPHSMFCILDAEAASSRERMIHHPLTRTSHIIYYMLFYDLHNSF